MLERKLSSLLLLGDEHSATSIQVPKLNRGMRPQVIVKKMQLPKKLDSAEEMSDDDVNDLDLVIKRSMSSFF